MPFSREDPVWLIYTGMYSRKKFFFFFLSSYTFLNWSATLKGTFLSVKLFSTIKDCIRLLTLTLELHYLAWQPLHLWLFKFKLISIKVKNSDPLSCDTLQVLSCPTRPPCWIVETFSSLGKVWLAVLVWGKISNGLEGQKFGRAEIPPWGGTTVF